MTFILNTLITAFGLSVGVLVVFCLAFFFSQVYEDARWARGTAIVICIISGIATAAFIITNLLSL